MSHLFTSIHFDVSADPLPLIRYIYAFFGTLSSIIILARFVFVKSDGVQGPRKTTYSTRHHQSGEFAVNPPFIDIPEFSVAFDMIVIQNPVADTEGLERTEVDRQGPEDKTGGVDL